MSKAFDGADFPYAKYDAAGRMARAFDPEIYARKEAASKARHDVRQPDDLVYYPNHGMKVSRFGADEGAVRREVKSVEIETDGKKEPARRAVDGLDRMAGRGDISKDELAVARLFQSEFDRCGFQHYSSVDFNRVGSGRLSYEDVLARCQRSRDYIGSTMKILGGDTQMWRAVFWIVGCGWKLEDVANQEGRNKSFWSGVLQSALTIMAQDYKRMMGGKRRVRHQGVMPDRLV